MSGGRVLGVIPARGGSKGIRQKNLAKLGGKPLLQYTLEAASASRELDRLVLSTEDEEIAAFGREFGIEVPFRRPKSLSGDRISAWEVIRHAVERLDRNEGYRPDVVMTLQPTSPLRQTRHIDEAIREFRRRRVDSVIGVCRVKEHPYEVVAFTAGRMRRAVEPLRRVRGRQDYPEFFYINGAIYLTRRDVLLRPGPGYGTKVWGYVMDFVSSFDIDTPEDLVVAESLVRCMPQEGQEKL